MGISPSPCSQLLPTLSFRSLDLELIELSPAATRLFNHAQPLPGSNESKTALDFLRTADRVREPKEELGRLREQLGYLANECERLEWGQTVVLDYFVEDKTLPSGKAEKRADVLVSLSNEEVYSIVFVRPHNAPRSPSTSLLPTLPSYEPKPTVSPPIESPPVHPQTRNTVMPLNYMTHFLSSQQGTSPNDSSASESTGDSQSNSSGLTKRSARTPVGKEREKLSFTPDAALMLSHAVNLVRDDGDKPAGSPEANLSSPRSTPRRGSTTVSLPSDLAQPQLSTTLPSSPRHSLQTLPEVISPSSPLPPAVLSDSNGLGVNGTSVPMVTTPDETPRVSRELDVETTDNLRAILTNSQRGSPVIGAADDTNPSEPMDVDGGDEGEEQKTAQGGEYPVGATRTPLNLQQLTDLVEVGPEICFIADASGQVEWLNDAWYRYTGLSNENHLSFDHWMSLFHADDMPTALGRYLHAMATGEPFTMEYRIKGADGKLRWMMCRGRAKRDETGTITGWMCGITDVQELITTRHEALLVQERTKAVLEGSSTFLLSVTPQLEIDFFEGSLDLANRLVSRDSDSIIGQQLVDFWNNAELLEATRKILDEEETSIGLDIESKDLNGTTFHARCRFVPLIGSPDIPSSHPDAQAVTGVIIVGTDVTQAVETANELQATRHEQAQLAASETAAREANRLKTEFLTTMSHEIRTPITQILGVCELLLADGGLGTDQRGLIEKAVRSGEVLLELVGAVLDVRKVEAGELVLEAAPFLVSHAVEDARLFAVTAQKKGLAFIEDIGEFYEGTVLGDRLRLRQALTNALSNAVKFTSTGSVTLRIRQTRETDEEIWLDIRVDDTGCGIEEKVLPTLFQPFRQADASTARKHGGSGLGLVIARKLVELMNGTVELTSQAGRGTSFQITVPLAKAPLIDVTDFNGARHEVPATSNVEAAEIRKTEQVVKEQRKRREPRNVRILLAEDNELIREIVTRTLKGMKFHIDAVEDGYACLERIRQEPYDVILMDGQMPGLDGYAATREIRQDPDDRVRTTRIIALTASAIQGDRERCLEVGMSAYLPKPVRAAELQRAIWEQVEWIDAA